MRELALFAGAGGGILGGILLGWQTVCAVENNECARSVLLARQNDGCFEPFPVWDDVCTFDGHPWRGSVDVVSGGFPCTDISSAGKGVGIEGEESGLWREMARIIGEVLPRFVFVENVPTLTSRGLGTVLGDLASMGFDAEWGVVGAHHAGAPHKRDRIWIVACDTDRRPGYVADAELTRLEGYRDEPGQPEDAEPRDASASVGAVEPVPELRELPVRDSQDARARLSVSAYRRMADEPVSDWWQSEPELGRVADGVAHRVDRLKCIGNGQVPSVAALAWTVLYERLNGR